MSTNKNIARLKTITLRNGFPKRIPEIVEIILSFPQLNFLTRIDHSEVS